MIVEDITGLSTGRTMHDIIDDTRDSVRAAKTSAINREYALGNHRPVSDADRKKLLGQLAMGDVSENLIGRCLQQIVSRIHFDEYQVNDQEVKAFLDLEVVAKNQMKRVMPSVMTRVQTDGSAALSLSWRRRPDDEKGGRPIIHHEQWWDGDKGMFVAVSDTGEELWAVSEWYDMNGTKFRTVYRRGEIIRFQQENNGWREVMKTDWVDRSGKPMAIPVIYFSNGSSPYGPYAESTVAKVIDAQDALNASLFNRQAVSALTGAQIYWAAGVQAPQELEVGAGKLWTSQDTNAKFGAIAPGDMKALLDEAEDLRQIIAGEFPVPTYRLGLSDWPSGLALIRADTPMIKRARSLIDTNEASVVRIAHRSVELKNAFGDGELDEDAIITVEFEPIDEIDPGTKVEIDQAKVDLYASLVDLPDPIIDKLDLLTKDEIAALKQWRRQQEAEQEVVVEDATPRVPVSQNGAS